MINNLIDNKKVEIDNLQADREQLGELFMLKYVVPNSINELLLEIKELTKYLADLQNKSIEKTTIVNTKVFNNAIFHTHENNKVTLKAKQMYFARLINRYGNDFFGDTLTAKDYLNLFFDKFGNKLNFTEKNINSITQQARIMKVNDYKGYDDASYKDLIEFLNN